MFLLLTKTHFLNLQNNLWKSTTKFNTDLTNGRHYTRTDAIVHVLTPLYMYGRYCTRTDAIVHTQMLLYTYGRYCTRTDAIVHVRKLYYELRTL